jgi:RNA-directed DNA polymerase
MAKGGSSLAAARLGRRSPVNIGAPEPEPRTAEARVLHLQRKLHKWAATDKHRRFCDLWNLVRDPAVIQVAWSRVRSNRGSRTAGIDVFTRHHVEHRYGVDRFLGEIRSSLGDRSFRPVPVRQRGIPKKGGKVRYLGIPTLRDRVVQMALKLVLEPIFEAGCAPRGAVSPGEVKGLAGRLSQQAERSWGQPGPGGAGLGGSSPRQRSGGDGTARRRRPRKQDGKGQ